MTRDEARQQFAALVGVEDSAIDLTYLPLDAAGFALRMLSISALALSSSLSGPKDTLPMGAWMIAVLSTGTPPCPP